MAKRIIWFFIGMITAVVLVVGGIAGGAYYFVSTQSINSVEDMLGQDLPILSEDPDGLRDKSLLELFVVISETLSDEETTLGDIRTTFGLQELIQDEMFGLDLSGIYDVKLSEIDSENALRKLMDGVTLRVLTDGLGMNLSHISFLNNYVDYPILDFMTVFNSMALGTLLESTESVESNNILNSIMFVEDEEGEFVRWTNPNDEDSYARYEDFNVNREGVVKFRQVEEGKYRVDRNVADGETFYVNINGFYVSNTDAAEYYENLATAKRYYGLTFVNGDFSKVVNGIRLGDVVTNIQPGDLLYELKNVKLSEVSSEISNIINDFAIASFMQVSTTNGILAGIAVTEVEPANAYVLNSAGEYVAWNGSFDSNYRDGLFYKKTTDDGEKYVPYYIVNSENVYESSAVADVLLSSYTGKYYVATTVAELSSKIDAITVLDAIGGLDAINEQSILQALAFAKYDAGVSKYDGSVFYKKVSNGANDPAFIYQVAEASWSGDKYYPVKAADIADRIADLSIQDIMSLPAGSHKILVDLWNSNCKVGEIGGQIDSIINGLTIRDFISDPTGGNNRILIKLWNSECGINDIESVLSDLRMQDVIDADSVDNKILKRICEMNPRLLGDDLSACFNDLLNDLEVADVIQLQADSSPLIKALLYTHEYIQVNPTIDEITSNPSLYYILKNGDDKHISVECLSTLPEAGTYTVHRYLTVADVDSDEHEQYYWYNTTTKLYEKVDSTTALTEQIYTGTNVSDLEHRMNEIRAGDVFADMENGKGLGAIITRSTLIVDIANDIETFLNFDSLTIGKLFAIAGEDIEAFMTTKGITGDKREVFKNMNIKQVIDNFADSFASIPLN